MDSELKIIIEAAKSGGEVLKKYFGQVLRVEEKSTAADYRTKADVESEEIILDILSKSFPDHSIFSEERGYQEKSPENLFIIDPLDGSNNFVMGVPNFSVSIGMLRNDDIVSSVVHIPMTGQTYYAQKGKGAYLDEKKISVNSESDIKRSTISYSCGYINSRRFRMDLYEKLHQKEVKRILDNWSPATEYCLLASGKLEAIINNDNDIYDYSGGKLIAREAGALITDFSGKPESSDRNSIFLATNGSSIHNELVEMLRWD
jgi:myo-inositol-1(or 4)-monophosphatase